MEKERLRIFIAEDEPIVQAGFQAMAEEIGHEIVGTAFDGESAVADILKSKPDLVLMDINLPGIDGITAIEKVNEKMEIPAVIITGYRSQNFVERAVEAGVYGYLQNHNYADAFRYGICTGSASAFSEELATKAEVEALIDKNKNLF